MTDAVSLLVDLRSRGICVDFDGAEIRLRAAPGILSPDLIQAVKVIKPQIQALLVAEEAEIAWRVEAITDRLADGPLPLDLVVADRPPAAGVCRSCGDPMPYAQVGKCTLCCLASARIVLASLRAGIGQQEGAP